jgi:hypothetical protein
MFITIDFPADWNGIRYTNEWRGSTAAGTPSPMTEQNKI